ncbi:ATP-binding protein [Azospirillum sp. B510]|uniref:ATP-binding protein n=1 Tax=Azospirillum sp. (strain B510) TaxID=137722 RepID=UPI0002E691E3|nr:ATP-binding protein [Azospirillum sp. B510]
MPALAVALAIAALWWILLDRLHREERLLDLGSHDKTAVLARLVEEHAVSTFRRVDDLLLDLIAQTERHNFMRLESRRAFEEGLVVGVRLYDASGALTMGGGRDTFQGGITDRDEFRIARDAAPRGLVVGIPYASSETRDPLIPVSRRLENADGTFAGIAVADIPVVSFVRYYRVLGLPPDGAVSLLRSDGIIIARSAGTRPPSVPGPVSADLWQAIKQHSVGHLRMPSPIDGVERIIAFRSAPDYPLIATVGEPVETVFGPWRDSARLYIGWAVATTVVILLFVTAFIVELQWRRHTDRALRVRNRALAWSNDGIMIADATQPGMPIVYVNPALERLLGSPASALMGSGALTALERATNDRAALQPLREAILVGRDARVELTRPGQADGTGAWEARCLELSASPVRDHDSRLVSLIATVRDISDHKRAQAALADARREADRANVAKSKFLAAASHDLRQPVQSLMLLMEVLSSRVSDGMTRSVLGTMERALGALKMLLDGLLDVSRLEAGAVEPQVEVFPLSEVLDRVAANSRPVAVQKGLILHIVPCGAHVRSDPMLLGRIIQNLVENALRYTDRGRVLVGCRRRGARLRIEVWDTGIGIPADQQEDIFQEFVQVGNASRNRDQGLGLGLAVVRRLSVMLDHEVTVRSSPGKGSVFALELPLANPPAAKPAPAPFAARPACAAITVLVIEDDEVVREGLRAMLAEWGYGVLSAASCAEALDLANGGPAPDLIVADYRLRDGRTGTEAIREVRLALGRSLPGILVTGDTAPARAQEAEAGNFRVMHKPVIAADLRRAVAETLDPLLREARTVA